jgi:fluoroquinolone transport system ATP-binding protein
MIEVENLRFSYPGSSDLTVRGISFRIDKGEIFGFLGPSGAVKSTTQNILVGLLTDWEGSVRVDGRNLAEWGSEYNQRIGVSFELPNHYSKLTARENLEFFRALYAGETATPEEVLELVGLTEHIDKPAGDFSKGMKNRLNFARSLLNRLELWFPDEPTSGVDPVRARHIRDLIRQQQEHGVTAFVTTHDMVAADEICDRVAFMGWLWALIPSSGPLALMAAAFGADIDWLHAIGISLPLLVASMVYAHLRFHPHIGLRRN